MPEGSRTAAEMAAVIEKARKDNVRNDTLEQLYTLIGTMRQVFPHDQLLTLERGYRRLNALYLRERAR